MTNRAKFIEWVENRMEYEDVEQEVREYFEEFKESKPPLITEKGAEITKGLMLVVGLFLALACKLMVL